MRLKPALLLLCLTLLPALAPAAEKTVYGLNEYARLGDLDLVREQLERRQDLPDVELVSE